MEIKKIPFIPEFQLQNISARAIENALFDNLVQSIDMFKGARVEMTEKKIAIQIAISVDSKCIERDPVSRIGQVENPYMLSEGLKQTLEPFLDIKKKINTSVVRVKKGEAIIIELNTLKTINNLFEPAGDGYEYEIFAIIPQKNNSILQLSKSKIKHYNKDKNNSRGC